MCEVLITWLQTDMAMASSDCDRHIDELILHQYQHHWINYIRVDHDDWELHVTNSSVIDTGSYILRGLILYKLPVQGRQI